MERDTQICMFVAICICFHDYLFHLFHIQIYFGFGTWSTHPLALSCSSVSPLLSNQRLLFSLPPSLPSPTPIHGHIHSCPKKGIPSGQKSCHHFLWTALRGFEYQLHRTSRGYESQQVALSDLYNFGRTKNSARTRRREGRQCKLAARKWSGGREREEWEENGDVGGIRIEEDSFEGEAKRKWRPREQKWKSRIWR